MIHTILHNRKVILASSSPRRKQLFKMLGLRVLHKPAHIDEDINIKSPSKHVTFLAAEKASQVAKTMDADCVVVGADTIVYHNKEILSKPENRYQAADFLTRLSGKSHYVYTGISVCYKRKCFTDYEKTLVTFDKLTAQEICDYLETAEPDDKAGAYGIQGYGSQFITKINGCYFNVMGFPVNRFYQLLQRIFII